MCLYKCFYLHKYLYFIRICIFFWYLYVVHFVVLCQTQIQTCVAAFLTWNKTNANTNTNLCIAQSNIVTLKCVWDNGVAITMTIFITMMKIFSKQWQRCCHYDNNDVVITITIVITTAVLMVLRWWIHNDMDLDWISYCWCALACLMIYFGMSCCTFLVSNSPCSMFLSLDKILLVWLWPEVLAGFQCVTLLTPSFSQSYLVFTFSALPPCWLLHLYLYIYLHL